MHQREEHRGGKDRKAAAVGLRRAQQQAAEEDLLPDRRKHCGIDDHLPAAVQLRQRRIAVAEHRKERAEQTLEQIGRALNPEQQHQPQQHKGKRRGATSGKDMRAVIARLFPQQHQHGRDGAEEQVARALKGLKLPRGSSEQGRPEHDHIHQHMPEQHHAVRIAQTFARKPLRAKLLLSGSALLEHPGVKPGALRPGRRPSPDRDVAPIDLAQRRLNRRRLVPFFIHLGSSSFLPLCITASAQSIPSTAALMMPPA